MATQFKNKIVKDLGTTPVTVFETGINSRATVIGLSLANLTSGIVLVSVQVRDDTNTTGYYAKDIIVPPNSSLRVINGGEKLILGFSNALIVTSNFAASIDAVISYVEIV